MTMVLSPVGAGVVLATTPREAAAIRSGAAQVRTVDGTALRYPSQDLVQIESTRPFQPGQTHDLTRHVGKTLVDDLARLAREPQIRAAGAYDTIASAQLATNRTIANPANQGRIGTFLADAGTEKIALERVDVGQSVGASVLRTDADAGHAHLIPSSDATVVLIKDPSFPEGYRVLTSFPDTRAPQVDARGFTAA